MTFNTIISTDICLQAIAVSSSNWMYCVEHDSHSQMGPCLEVSSSGYD